MYPEQNQQDRGTGIKVLCQLLAFVVAGKLQLSVLAGDAVDTVAQLLLLSSQHLYLCYSHASIHGNYHVSIST